MHIAESIDDWVEFVVIRCYSANESTEKGNDATIPDLQQQWNRARNYQSISKAFQSISKPNRDMIIYDHISHDMITGFGYFHFLLCGIVWGRINGCNWQINCRFVNLGSFCLWICHITRQECQIREKFNSRIKKLLFLPVLCVKCRRATHCNLQHPESTCNVTL